MRNRHIQVRLVKDATTPTTEEADPTLIADQMYIITETAKSVGKVVAGLMVLKAGLRIVTEVAVITAETKIK